MTADAEMTIYTDGASETVYTYLLVSHIIIETIPESPHNEFT